MIKLSRDIGIALLAAAAASHVAPASAAMENYTCYRDHAFNVSGENPKYLGHVYNKPMSLKQCLELCDATGGCVAAIVGQGLGAKYPNCVLFSTASTHYLFPPTKMEGVWSVLCVKKFTYPKSGDTPQTHQEIPKIPHEQYRQQPTRPAPQPTQPPGGRR